jgi:hypothetical protein
VTRLAVVPALRPRWPGGLADVVAALDECLSIDTRAWLH